MSLQEPFEIKCRVCRGAGYHLSAEPPFRERNCGACNGTGYSPEYAELQRDIETIAANTDLKAHVKIHRLETMLDRLKPAMQTILNEAEKQGGGQVDAQWLVNVAREALKDA